MLIKNAKEWQDLGYYWSWANGSGRIFKRPYREGSPTINRLMIEGGYAHDTEEAVIEWLEKMSFDRLEISESDFLYFEDFQKIRNYSNIIEVFEYLNNKSKEINIIFLPSGKYLLKKDITKQSLLKFGIKRRSLLERIFS